MGIINRDIEADAVTVSVEGMLRGLAPAMPDGWAVTSVACLAFCYETSTGSKIAAQWTVQGDLGKRARCIGCGPTLQLALDALHLDATAKVAALDLLATSEAK